ncbi:G1/S-specific cyclin-D1 [Xenoophorus captivus]|uniref:G1/S-specific cyclin-D1 n=1 Tax=Xenoophorus captivus TaxID=1517983 RepID=A0ABV0SBS6_9TELE
MPVTKMIAIYMDQNYFLVSIDVNFVASPPSMVAAGSVVAAVQGLYLKSQDTSLSSPNLTNFLSQVIRSDPVCSHTLPQRLPAVMSGADRVPAGVQSAAGSAAQWHDGNQTHG